MIRTPTSKAQRLRAWSVSDDDGHGITAYEDVGEPLPARLAPAKMDEAASGGSARYDAMLLLDSSTEVSQGDYWRIDGQVWQAGASWPGPAVVRVELTRFVRS